MLTKLIELRSVPDTIIYLLQERDNQKRTRARIEIEGSHSLQEFLRLAINFGSSGGRAADHLVVAMGKDCGPGWRTRADAIGNALVKFLFLGLVGGVPWIRVRHTNADGSFHDHYLFLRFHFLSGHQISLLPAPQDIEHLMLFQTGQNVRFGAIDPFDPAFARQLAFLPRELSQKLANRARRIQVTLRDALVEGIVQNNQDARDFLANRGCRVRITNRRLVLEIGKTAIVLTTPAFGEVRPMPLTPGALRPWFTIEHRELLRRANTFRALRHIVKYPVLPFHKESLRSENGPYSGRHEQTQSSASIPPTHPKTVSPGEPPTDLDSSAGDDELEPTPTRFTRARLAELQRQIGKELTRWHGATIGLCSGIGRGDRRIDGPTPGRPARSYPHLGGALPQELAPASAPPAANPPPAESLGRPTPGELPGRNISRGNTAGPDNNPLMNL